MLNARRLLGDYKGKLIAKIEKKTLTFTHQFLPFRTLYLHRLRVLLPFLLMNRWCT